jgi:hypothetical protein
MKQYLEDSTPNKQFSFPTFMNVNAGNRLPIVGGGDFNLDLSRWSGVAPPSSLCLFRLDTPTRTCRIRAKCGKRTPIAAGVIDYLYASSLPDTWPAVHASPASQIDLDAVATHLARMQLSPPLQLENISNHDPLCTLIELHLRGCGRCESPVTLQEVKACIKCDVDCCMHCRKDCDWCDGAVCSSDTCREDQCEGCGSDCCTTCCPTTPLVACCSNFVCLFCIDELEVCGSCHRPMCSCRDPQQSCTGPCEQNVCLLCSTHCRVCKQTMCASARCYEQHQCSKTEPIA